MLYLDYVRSLPVYKELIQVHNTGEGNLLEITDVRTAEAQIEFMRWAINGLGTNTMYLEIGHNKGLWCLLLSHIVPDAEVIAIDINPDSAKAAKILNDNTALTVDFRLGNSIEVLPQLIEESSWGYCFAWIDGNHEYEFTLADLKNVVDLNVYRIAVDDTNMSGVARAIDTWLQTAPYTEVPNPFYHADSRRARLFQYDPTKDIV